MLSAGISGPRASHEKRRPMPVLALASCCRLLALTIGGTLRLGRLKSPLPSSRACQLNVSRHCLGNSNEA